MSKRDPLKPLLYWIKERENIRRAKEEAGEAPPWSRDWIFQEFRFCNVRRKDDRVSRWLINNVLQYCPQKDRSLLSFIEWVTLCRFVNWPPSLMQIQDYALNLEPIDTSWPAIGRLLDRRHRQGEKTWTGAYMIKGHPKGKGKYIARMLAKGFRKYGEVIVAAAKTNSCADTHLALTMLPECGQFLAGQVVADLTYTRLLKNATDLYTWAPLGPGSRRGYNRLMGLPLKAWPEEYDFIVQLILWRQRVVDELGVQFADMTLHDLQNCLCEVDKYLRVKNGEGRPRSRYAPETAYDV